MNNKSRSTSFSRISSKSFSTQFTTDNQLLSSTRNPIQNKKVFDNNNRRKEVIPTPNRPKLIDNSFAINIEMNTPLHNETELVMNNEERIQENTLCSTMKNKFLESFNKDTKVDNESDSQCVAVNSSRQLTLDEVVDTGDALLLDQKS
ncbi:unnamed protein product, partial [Rotaria socialis]